MTTTPLDEPAFWQLLADVDPAERGRDRLTRALVPRLARLPVPQIAAFHILAVQHCDRLLTWELWEATDIIFRAPVSEDTFSTFRPWIVALGQQAFNDALDDPDLLAEHPAVIRLAGLPRSWSNADDPHADELLAVGELAFDLVLTKLHPRYAAQVERPPAFDHHPRGVPYPAPPPDFGDPGRVRKLYPWLVDLFA